jgi:hypothetical protein
MDGYVGCAGRGHSRRYWRGARGDEEVELYAGTFEAWCGNVEELLEEHGFGAPS